MADTIRLEIITPEKLFYREEVELVIAKHRNGALDDIPLTFKTQFAKFVEPENFNLSFDSPQIIGSKMNDDVVGNDAEYGNSPFPTEGRSEGVAPF